MIIKIEKVSLRNPLFKSPYSYSDQSTNQQPAMAVSTPVRWFAFALSLIFLGSLSTLSWWIHAYKGDEPDYEICSYGNCTSFATYMTITYSLYIISAIVLTIWACIMWSGNEFREDFYIGLGTWFLFCTIWSWIIIFMYYSKGWTHPTTSLQWLPFILWLIFNLVLAVAIILLMVLGIIQFCKNFDCKGLFISSEPSHPRESPV